MSSNPTIIFWILILWISLWSREGDDIIFRNADIASAPQLGYVRNIYNHNCFSFDISDINGDGQFEIAYYNGTLQKYISIRSIDNLVISEIPVTQTVIYHRFIDINDDGKQEIIFISKDGYKAYLNIFDVFSETYLLSEHLLWAGQELHDDDDWDLVICDIKKFNASDGTPLLLILAAAGHDLQPRGVYAFDLKSLKMAWAFPTASRPHDHMIFHDIDRDGRAEILFSTWAPGNFYSAHNDNDSLSSFFVLDDSGQLIFKRNFAGPFSYCFFMINGTSGDILIYGYTNSAISSGLEYVIYKKGQFEDEGILKSDLFSKRSRLAGRNRIKDNFDFNLLSDRPRFYLLDQQLNPIKKMQINLKVKFINTDNIDDDLNEEYWLLIENSQNGNETLVLLDHNFDFYGKHELKNVHFLPEIFTHPDNKHISIFFIESEGGWLKEVFIPQSDLLPAYSLSFYWKRLGNLILLIGAVLVIFYILGVLIHLLYKKNKHLFKLYQLSRYLINTPTESILILNEQNQIEDYNTSFAALFYLPLPGASEKNLLREIITTDDAQRLLDWIETAREKLHPGGHESTELNLTIHSRLYKLACEIHKIAVKNNTYLLLVKLNDLTQITQNQHVASWASMAQRLAHEIKNPLMSLTLSLGRLEKKLFTSKTKTQPDAERYLQYIHEDIERMRDKANQFMQFTSAMDYKFESVPVARLIQATLDKQKNFIAGGRIAIHYQPLDSIMVWVSEAQTLQAFQNIIENAIDAIEGEGDITIRQSQIEKIDPAIHEVKSYARIEISDSGHGMNEEQMGKVFDPGFTTKNTGSGFGLPIARHVIEEQGGSIFLSSKPQVGTTISIDLPQTVTAPVF